MNLLMANEQLLSPVYKASNLEGNPSHNRLMPLLSGEHTAFFFSKRQKISSLLAHHVSYSDELWGPKLIQTNNLHKFGLAHVFFWGLNCCGCCLKFVNSIFLPVHSTGQNSNNELTNGHWTCFISILRLPIWRGKPSHNRLMPLEVASILYSSLVAK